MPNLTERDMLRLATCDVRWQMLLPKIAEKMWLMVIGGHRNEEKQNEAFRNGLTQVRWPNSKHNLEPSLAVDLAPLPLDWKNTRHFFELAAHVWAESLKNDVSVIWGGSFSFGDYGHFELR
ncbi:MAG TPA: hypothetical protein ENI07_00880 [Desulfobacterales bacterium]|nr:hypothetical protein [Desulfobacterales bacterium]